MDTNTAGRTINANTCVENNKFLTHKEGQTGNTSGWLSVGGKENGNCAKRK